MYYFCTYFDHRYLPRGLALYWSLRKHCHSFLLWVLCMDTACYELLSQMRLPNIHLIALEDFERGDEDLLRAKKNRSLVEYYFTCTPSLPLFVLDQCPDVDIITYLDADLFFFADPAQIYNGIANHSVAIIEHRFPPKHRSLECFGIYNVGWLSFRRDANAFACLRWWRERCIEWCYDRCEDGRFADQKYLDNWPTLFQGVVVLHHKGANLAPWNLANYCVRGDENSVWIDEQPLVFFHFHGLKQIKERLYSCHLATHKVSRSATATAKRLIYAPYVRAVFDFTQQVLQLLQQNTFTASGESKVRKPYYSQKASLLRQVLRSSRKVWNVCRNLLYRDYIIVRKNMP